MKKSLFLIVSLLSISCIACFTGCNQKENGDGEMVKDDVQARIISAENEETENVENESGDNCPDGNCDKHSMPKVHFEFKNGRPASRHGDNGSERNVDNFRGRRHGKHRHSHRKPTPPIEENPDEN